MRDGEVLKSNEDDPKFRRTTVGPQEPVSSEADEVSVGERLEATPGEPAITKVPLITQDMTRERHEHRWGDDGACEECGTRRA